VEFWPQHFLIAPNNQGGWRLVHTHYGDRNHHEMEQYISNILCRNYIPIEPYNHQLWLDVEIFLGRSHRRKNLSTNLPCENGVCKLSFASPSVIVADAAPEKVTLEFNKGITNGTITFLSSEWNTTKEYIQSTTDNAQLELDFKMSEIGGENLSLYIVAEPLQLSPENENENELLKQTLVAENSSDDLLILNNFDPNLDNRLNHIFKMKYQPKKIIGGKKISRSDL